MDGLAFDSNEGSGGHRSLSGEDADGKRQNGFRLGGSSFSFSSSKRRLKSTTNSNDTLNTEFELELGETALSAKTKHHPHSYYYPQRGTQVDNSGLEPNDLQAVHVGSLSTVTAATNDANTTPVRNRCSRPCLMACASAVISRANSSKSNNSDGPLVIGLEETVQVAVERSSPGHSSARRPSSKV